MQTVPQGVYEPAWMEIDLDAFEFNLDAIKRHVGDKVKFMPVLKGDAYGAGAEVCAEAAVGAGVDALAVVRVREAVALRSSGVKLPILNLGFCTDLEITDLLKYNISQSVHRLDLVAKLNAVALASGKIIGVHLNVDTGMSRSGLPFRDVNDFFELIKGLKGLKLEGVFTHFHSADGEDKSFAYGQIAEFETVRAAALNAGFSQLLFHTANTAATIDIPESHFDMVRPGIGIYGLYASRHISRKLNLRQISSLRALVSNVQTLNAGCGVSYGHTYVTDRRTKIATVQAGYVDGVNRRLSNVGYALIHGQVCPIAGRVTMDQTMLELPDSTDVKVGDVATFYGSDGSETILMDDHLDIVGIAHEIQTGIAVRVPRVYLRGGEVVRIMRYSAFSTSKEG
ncbi:MAG: alanine racemase [Lentisphaerae bacterium]|nr:alanine racemase [Lentisphaerota bacterium]